MGQPRPPSASGVGRPRANPGVASGEAREEILRAARTLFREKGFKGTTTREIAVLAGLRQPSLFHHFKSKAEIFRAVALGAVEPVLSFMAVQAKRRQAPDVALYRLVHFDTYHLCTNENALGSPFQFPELSRESQPEFWQLRDEILNGYRTLLRRGVRGKLFRVPDLEISTQLLFAFGESTLTWHAPGPGASAAKVAHSAATLAVRSVLIEPERLEDIAMRAHCGPAR